jgi:hypothetical protein
LLDLVRPNDHLYFDLVSDDIWIQVSIEVPGKDSLITLECKVRTDFPIYELKSYLVSVTNQQFVTSGSPADYSTDDLQLYKLKHSVDRNRQSSLFDTPVHLPKGERLNDKETVGAHFDFLNCAVVCEFGVKPCDSPVHRYSITRHESETTSSSVSLIKSDGSMLYDSVLESEYAAKLTNIDLPTRLF